MPPKKNAAKAIANADISELSTKKEAKIPSDRRVDFDESTVIFGANDMHTLPIEQLQAAVIKNGYAIDMTKSLEKWQCIKILTKINNGNSVFSTTQEEDDERVRKEKEEESEKAKEAAKNLMADQKSSLNFDPTSYKKESGDIIIGIVNTASKTRPRWQPLKYFDDIDISKYVPVDVLNSLPIANQDNICNELTNLMNFRSQTRINHVGGISRNKYMTITEIIRTYISPCLPHKTSTIPADSTDDEELFHKPIEIDESSAFVSQLPSDTEPEINDDDRGTDLRDYM